MKIITSYLQCASCSCCCCSDCLQGVAATCTCDCRHRLCRLCCLQQKKCCKLSARLHAQRKFQVRAAKQNKAAAATTTAVATATTTATSATTTTKLNKNVSHVSLYAMQCSKRLSLTRTRTHTQTLVHSRIVGLAVIVFRAIYAPLHASYTLYFIMQLHFECHNKLQAAT